MNRILTFAVFAVFAVFALFTTACDSGRASADKAGAATAPTPPAAAPTGPAPVGDRAAALTVFATRCAPCHGAQGAGDGAAAASLNPAPRNFRDKTWQSSITDDQIEKIVREGGQAVGKSPTMPANKDLLDQPQVIVGLRGIIREFGSQ